VKIFEDDITVALIQTIVQKIDKVN